MSDDLIDGGAVDVTALSLADLRALGDSVLGYAVRRVLSTDGGGGVPLAGDPIAAFQDSM